MADELPIPTPNGFDSLIAIRNPEWASFLPEGVEVRLLGNRAAVIDGDWRPLDSARDLMKATIALRILVRQAIELGGIPDRVQMAWFTVTRDPAVVVRYGQAHGCATCRAGTDQALAHLREHQEPLVVGLLAF